MPPSATSTSTIDTVGSLKRHLQTALTLELSTIPPYLCALYSLKDGTNLMVANIIRSVVMEEMLHMTLVANLLNAIGGHPTLNEARHVPSYWTYLPHSDDAFEVHLRPFSRCAVDTFLHIERPARPDAPAQADHFKTIGQFYKAIAAAFTTLFRNGHRFDTGRQVSGDHWYYGGGGVPILVDSRESALEAIREISEQGEGLPHHIFDGDRRFGEPEEPAHYFRFKEIQLGRRYRASDTPSSGPTGPELPVDWSAVYPMDLDPKADKYEQQPDIHRRMVDFNRRYTDLLLTLHDAFNGRAGLLQQAVPIMYELKYAAQELMRIPAGKDADTTVGPGFEFVK